MKRRLVLSILSFAYAQTALAVAEKDALSMAPAHGLALIPNSVSSPCRGKSGLGGVAGGAHLRGHFQKAMHFQKQGELDRALVEYLKATEENPRLVQAFYQQAVIFRERGYLKLSQSALEEALAVKPDFGEARVLLATIRLQQGNLAGAVTELSRCLGLPESKGELAAVGAYHQEPGVAEESVLSQGSSTTPAHAREAPGSSGDETDRQSTENMPEPAVVQMPHGSLEETLAESSDADLSRALTADRTSESPGSSRLISSSINERGQTANTSGQTADQALLPGGVSASPVARPKAGLHSGFLHFWFSFGARKPSLKVRPNMASQGQRPANRFLGRWLTGWFGASARIASRPSQLKSARTQQLVRKRQHDLAQAVAASQLVKPVAGESSQSVLRNASASAVELPAPAPTLGAHLVAGVNGWSIQSIKAPAAVPKGGYQPFPQTTTANANRPKAPAIVSKSSGKPASGPRSQLSRSAGENLKDRDPMTARMKFLLKNGVATLKTGESFMYSEETGEAVLFLTDGSVVRRHLARAQAADDVVGLRRPDISRPGDLQYNLSLLGKLMPHQPKPVAGAQPASRPAGLTMEQALGHREGLWGWLRQSLRL